MQLHELKPKHKIKKGKRVGRGGKRGTYSGKGMKGQKSRAGRKFQPIIRELIKRYPKLKGYRVSPLAKKMKKKKLIKRRETFKSEKNSIKKTKENNKKQE